ncbi:hypothetical protein E1200_32570 [Actinomadura sp. GC306]|uniref:hypothetical protein n=1 Tax=Actinomadura sp. GC306 TaxID=2530367 RepID=UPI00104C2198|nr:hypothetical protein [Actinomadura sp. GC306]TDC59053.1 hypothetical protein E1200_32570 [Actinomadura sp. GC306]
MRVRKQPSSRGGERLTYRLLLAVDLDKYSRLDAQQQLTAQNDLRGLLDGCARRAGLGTNGWYRQVGGDGELIVLPPDVDVPLILGVYANDLDRALDELNRRRSTRLRMRLALHHGTLIDGPLGPAGDAPIVVSRLLDAAPLRHYLSEHRDRDLALVVSDTLYKDVVTSGFCSLHPADFFALEVEIKERIYRGYVHHRAPASSTTPNRSSIAHTA